MKTKIKKIIVGFLLVSFNAIEFTCQTCLLKTKSWILNI